MRNMVLVVLFAVGCVGDRVAYSPLHGPTPHSDGHRRALLALTDMGKTVEVNDPASGVILTAWEEETVLGEKGYRYKYRVSVNAGAYDVASLCQMWVDNVVASDEWTDCDPKIRPKSVIDTMDKIASALR